MLLETIKARDSTVIIGLIPREVGKIDASATNKFLHSYNSPSWFTGPNAKCSKKELHTIIIDCSSTYHHRWFFPFCKSSFDGPKTPSKDTILLLQNLPICVTLPTIILLAVMPSMRTFIKYS